VEELELGAKPQHRILIPISITDPFDCLTHECLHCGPICGPSSSEKFPISEMFNWPAKRPAATGQGDYSHASALLPPTKDHFSAYNFRLYLHFARYFYQQPFARCFVSSIWYKYMYRRWVRNTLWGHAWDALIHHLPTLYLAINAQVYIQLKNFWLWQIKVKVLQFHFQFAWRGHTHTKMFMVISPEVDIFLLTRKSFLRRGNQLRMLSNVSISPFDL